MYLVPTNVTVACIVTVAATLFRSELYGRKIHSLNKHTQIVYTAFYASAIPCRLYRHHEVFTQQSLMPSPKMPTYFYQSFHTRLATNRSAIISTRYCVVLFHQKTDSHRLRSTLLLTDAAKYSVTALTYQRRARHISTVATKRRKGMAQHWPKLPATYLYI